MVRGIKFGIFFIIAFLILFLIFFHTRKINIGIVLPLSGDFKNDGISIKNGLVLAQDIFNSKRSNKKYHINLFIADSRGIPEKAAKKTRELIDKNKVEAVIGGVMTEETAAIASVCEEKKIAMICPGSSDSKLSGIGKFFFRIRPSDEMEGRLMASKIKNFQFTEGIRFFEYTLVLFNHSNYAENVKTSFIDNYEKNKGKVVSSIQYDTTAEETENIIKKSFVSLKKLDTAAIYIIGRPEDTTSLLLQLRKLTAFDPSAFKIFISMKSFTEGFKKNTSSFFIQRNLDKYTVVFPMIADLRKNNPDKDITNFIKNYIDKYKTDPETNAALGYDALMLAAESLSGRGTFTGDLQQDLISISEWKGVTGVIGFNNEHDYENITLYGYDGKDLLSFEMIKRKGFNRFFVQVWK